MQVIKRSGETVEYDASRIMRAVEKAYSETNSRSIPAELEESLWYRLDDYIVGYAIDNQTIDVEQIQDFVEKALMDNALHDVAKAYILYRKRHADLRDASKKPSIEAIQDFILVDKYARYLPDEQRRETYQEVVKRVEDMHIRKFPEVEEDIREAFKLVYDKRVLPSMRSMQFAGPAIEKNNARMYNCSFSFCDRWYFFSQAFYLLMCGCGVGFSVERQAIEQLSPLVSEINHKEVFHYLIEDTLEGWAAAIQVLIEAYSLHGHYVEFNYSDIRKQGAPLKTSGGKAPGHLPLKKALEAVRGILDKALGRKLRPIEAYDIVMHIADAVLSGGIRRSATLCLFSPTDEEMINAKRGNWMQENPQRARSNNSAKLIRSDVSYEQYSLLFEAQKQYGEPGFYFCSDLKSGTNPCAEIGMYPYTDTEKACWQFCNLVEINGALLKTVEEFKEAAIAASMIATLQSGYTDFVYLGIKTEMLAQNEPLLGVSITGIADSKLTKNPDVLRQMANTVVDRNVQFSQKLGIPPAARTTCVKPSGTSSLLLGTASGIHPRHAKRYFRRIQCNTDDPVYQYFKSVNPQMCEKSVWSKTGTDGVITFCVEAPEDATVKDDLTAIQFLELVKSVQGSWVAYGANWLAYPDSNVSHNVSNTCVVKSEEWEEVKQFIWDNKNSFSGISLLPATGDKDYPQAPNEEIVTEKDEHLWQEIVRDYKPVDYTKMHEEEDNTNLQGENACGGGKCEL